MNVTIRRVEKISTKTWDSLKLKSQNFLQYTNFNITSRFDGLKKSTYNSDL